jgi:hypothetical protein
MTNGIPIRTTGSHQTALANGSGMDPTWTSRRLRLHRQAATPADRNLPEDHVHNKQIR